MRSSKSLFLAGCLTVLTMALVGLGCSDDTPTTTVIPVEVDEDNTIETLLEEVSSQANAHVDSVLTMVGDGLQVATFIDAGNDDLGNVLTGSGFPDSTREENNWIVIWATDLQAGLGIRTSVDSLTFIVAGALSASAKDATAMHIKHHFDYVTSDSTVSHTNVANTGYLDITGIDGNTATVSGVLTSVINDKEVTSEGTVWDDWFIETTISNFAVTKAGSSWTNGCPESGTVTMSIEHRHAEGLDVPVSTNWDMTATFTDGDAAVSVVTGQLSTSYENSFCTP